MRRLGVVCGVVFLIVSSVQAAGASKKTAKPAVSEQQPAPGPIQVATDVIRVRVGSGNVITFPSRVLRVAVGDEKIVAIHVVEARQILLQGLTPGRSTVFAWLSDGRRLKYDLVVSPRMEVLENALHDLDPRISIEQNGDGSSLVLSGKVANEKVSNEARQLAENMLGNLPGNSSRVINLLQFPGSNDADLRLTSALGDVDPRIRLRRIQVGPRVSNTADAVVLEGRVKDISALVRAITLAELQLGGVGGKIEPLSPDAADTGRNRNFTGVLPKLQSSDAPPAGLATYVARGLILKSASGRVLSFLEVDELPQIMVAIRVLQVDRGRARHLGIDYRMDGNRFSVGSFQQPGRTSIDTPASPPSINGLLGGNVVATFVDKTIAIAAAIDFLQQKDLARSVAEPNITTLSGESASVLVGGEVPIPTTTVGQTTSVQGFLFQDFGVRLDIRPTLAPNGLVAMEISPSIIRPSADLAVSGVPGFNVQSVQTTAKVAPGQTLVIGGLISFTEESQKRGVPGLSEIPLLKHLFSWEGRTLQEQEILFVITPRILNERADDVADALQWRDVEPLPAGTTVELPPLDADPPKTLTPFTLSPTGLPPAFREPPALRTAKPASKSGETVQPFAPSGAIVGTTTPAEPPAAKAPPVETPNPRPVELSPLAGTAIPPPAPEATRAEIVAISEVHTKPVMTDSSPVVEPASIPSKQSAKTDPPPPAKQAEVVQPSTDHSNATATTAPKREIASFTPHPEPEKSTPAPAKIVTPPAVKQAEVAQPLADHSKATQKNTTTVTANPDPGKAAPLPKSLALPAVKQANLVPASTASVPVPKPAPKEPTLTTAAPSASSSPQSKRSGAPIMVAQVNPELRASVTSDYKILVVVSPHVGDAWMRLARRLTGDPENWRSIAKLNNAGENLTSEQHVRVPFEMLRPELKEQIVGMLFPKGSAAESDWNRIAASGQATH